MMTANTSALERPKIADFRSLINPLDILSAFRSDVAEEDFVESRPTPEENDSSIFGSQIQYGIDDWTTMTPVQPVGHIYTAQEMQRLHGELTVLFADAKEEVFEDGVESEFSSHLLALIDEYGEFAMNQIILMAEEDKVEHEVLAEALRWFGHMEDGVAYSRRRWLLEQNLCAPSVAVRDGAILGLSFLEDLRSAPALERARQLEVHDALRADIEQVLHDLSGLLPGTEDGVELDSV